MDESPFNPIRMVCAEDYSEDELMQGIEPVQELHQARVTQVQHK